MAIKRSRAGAFSLIEVVVAIGVFAIAVVSAVALMSPLASATRDNREVDDAMRLMPVIQAELQEKARREGWADFTAALDGGTVYYFSREGTLNPAEPARRFVAATLMRNAGLSPGGAESPDRDAGFLAFTAMLRWPVYGADGQLVPAHGQASQGVPMAIVR